MFPTLKKVKELIQGRWKTAETTPIKEDPRIAAWVAWRESGLHRAKWSGNTKKTWLPYLQAFLRINKVVTPAAVAAWLAAIPPEHHSKRRHVHSAISSYARFQLEQGVLMEKAYQEIRRLYPRADRYRESRQRIINQGQLEKLIQAASKNRHRYQRLLNVTLLVFLSETGLRASEVCALRVEDIRFSDNPREATITIRCGKGGKKRLVPFTTKAQRAVRQYLKARPNNTDHSNLFLGFGPKEGYQPLDRHAIARRFQAMAEKTGIDFSCHSLRHYRITTWCQKHTTAIVQRLAGHSSLAMTEKYMHVQDEDALLAAFE